MQSFAQLLDYVSLPYLLDRHDNLNGVQAVQAKIVGEMR